MRDIDKPEHSNEAILGRQVPSRHDPATNLKVSYPDTLLDVLRQTPAELKREAKMSMAAKLFE